MVTIGILIFPQVEELDFVGPFEVLSYPNKLRSESTKVLTVAETINPVQAFNGLKVIPDIDFANCPPLDIIVVPGGKGRMKAMHDPAIRDFILQQAKTARYITSVCTGAFILAEAGILDGKRATTYFAALPELAGYPAIHPVKSKVVQDGSVITAAGVSSGLELGFYLLKLLFGREFAQEVAAKIEYDVDVEKL
ncbi:ThiJ/PfpI domain protein [Thermosinus carboxydivorans Nor1]|uniref:ThiJ/PfpI domain protein n=1 Tax=Thermosinus carboxydivorans Nor1 TaxID=401526 RepID=A1HRP9_9FIRM|nr:DJ-1/PfpI family protein [Thermosinus carboxydivorans]EAX47369.1 ThiJ/PfpI domain protein [Thermosinus carboxydivorans Nor1]